MEFWVAYTLLELLFGSFIVTGQRIVVTSSVDVSSGEVLCPNISVEITCTATKVGFLRWSVNNRNIKQFTAGDSPTPTGIILSPYTLFLDAVSLIPMTITANITSRLVVNLSDLMIGDQISCLQVNIEDSVIISYTLRAPPPAPSNYLITFEETSANTMSLNFTWDSTFNSFHVITSYMIVPTASQGSLVIECPLSCSPDVPCRCTGLAVGEQASVSISAINCGDQVGPVSLVTVASSCRVGDLGKMDNKPDVRCGSSLSSVSITNGVGCYSTTTTGSVVTYQCDEGYSLSAESQQTCQSDGNWDGSIPVCTASLRLSGPSTGFLVCTVLLLVVSLIVIVIGPVMMIIRKVSLDWWYILLLAIEVVLLTVVLLSIMFGVLMTSTNSTIIAAFTVSVLALLWIIATTVFVHVKNEKSGISKHQLPSVELTTNEAYGLPTKQSNLKRNTSSETKQVDGHCIGTEQSESAYAEVA